MRTEIAGRQVQVDFVFDNFNGSNDDHGYGNPETTHCTISYLEDGHATVVSSEKVTKHYNDASNKLLARKIAFTKALSSLSTNDPGFDKNIRKLFWDFYKENFRYRQNALDGKWIRDTKEASHV